VPGVLTPNFGEDRGHYSMGADLFEGRGGDRGHLFNFPQIFMA